MSAMQPHYISTNPDVHAVKQHDRRDVIGTLHSIAKWTLWQLICRRRRPICSQKSGTLERDQEPVWGQILAEAIQPVLAIVAVGRGMELLITLSAYNSPGH